MSTLSAWLVSHLGLAFLLSSLVVLTALAAAWRVRDPVARHRILLAFLPVLALLPLVQVAGGQLAPTSGRREAPHAPAAMPGAGTDAEIASHTRGGAVGPIARGDAPHQPAPPAWAPAAGAIVYVAGASILFVFIMLRALQTSRLLRTCSHIREPRILALWRSLVRGRAACAELLESARAASPGCCGIIKPRVVLPAREVAAPNTERLTLVLQHELVHVARRDVPVSLLQQIVRALLWFNPLVWLYSTLLTRYRELSCDAIVVRRTGMHQSYALALLQYCTPRAPRARLLGLAMADGSPTRSEIRRRLDMILTEQQHRSAGSLPRRLTTALAVLTLAGSVAAAAILGPGPMPDQPKGGGETKAQPEKAADKAPDARLRLVEARLVLERLKDIPWTTLAIELPPDSRRVDRIIDHLVESQPGMDRPTEGTITEQETLVSGEKVKVRGNVLLSQDLIVNMPEGSRLRSSIQGESVVVRSGDTFEVSAVKGVMRLNDEAGVPRVVVRAARALQVAAADGAAARKDAPAEGTLIITIQEDKGEVVMRFKATKPDGTPAEIHTELDLKTGVPAGEEDPPVGAVRYRLLETDREEAKPARVKIQWKHDLAPEKEEPKKAPAKPSGAR